MRTKACSAAAWAWWGGDGVGLGGGGTGVFVVLPGVEQVAEIQCLPSGEGVHLEEQTGERFSGAGSEAVCGQPLDLVDLGVEFFADDDGAELAIESADGVELLVRSVTVAGSTRRAASSNWRSSLPGSRPSSYVVFGGPSRIVMGSPRRCSSSLAVAGRSAPRGWPLVSRWRWRRLSVPVSWWSRVKVSACWTNSS